MDNSIIKSLNGWVKEELYNDFGLCYSKDVPKLIESLFGSEPNRDSYKSFNFSTFT